MGDVREKARRAVEAGARTVVAVGGDGTINRVLAGIMDAGGARTGVRMGVLYAGTSPDFCRFHGIPVEPEPAVDLLLECDAVAVDVARLRCRDGAGGECVTWFASSVNAGLGAGIARRANRYRAGLGDFLGTLAATVVTVLATRPALLDIEVAGADGGLRGRVLNVTVGKNPLIASGLELDVESGPADGRLYGFVVEGVSRLGLLRRLPGLYSGAAARDPRFRLLRGIEAVRLDSRNGPVECECDGDPAGWLPAEIRVLPRALRLVRPEP
jgi:diacylglycerol kinase family enzyme